MKKILVALAVIVGGSALALVLYGRTMPDQPDAAIWPGTAATVQAPAYVVAPDFGQRRIYIDAGHGAEDNVGNTSSLCQLEQDFTVALAQDLAHMLEATKHFEVRLSRKPGERVDYHTRVAEAARWRADAFISLHSDVRGTATEDGPCPQSLDAPGFSVLWSDHGSERLSQQRLELARAIAKRMQQMGLLAYPGDGYSGLYAGDTTAGVFVDRHQPTNRIFVLHKPTMPSVIIETHNAWDPREASRWNDHATRQAFAETLIAALTDVL